MISYLSISLVIRHNLNVHPVHSPALFVCLDQANDVTPQGSAEPLWAEDKNCLLLSLFQAGCKEPFSGSLLQGSLLASEKLPLTRAAGHLWWPDRLFCFDGLHGDLLRSLLLTKHTSAAGHPRCIAENSAIGREFSNGQFQYWSDPWSSSIGN